MNIYTIKFSKRKAVAIILILAIIISAVILAMPEKEAGFPKGADTETAAVKGIETAEDRLAYIQSLGYSCEAQPLEQREVVIPKTFDDIYTQYNAMQQECGFDLTPYQGKQAMLYTYRVTNYTGETEVLLDLLLCKKKIIGGAVYTAAIDGFMHGLMPNPSKG